MANFELDTIRDLYYTGTILTNTAYFLKVFTEVLRVTLNPVKYSDHT
jgi:hypothetical protein